MNRFFKILFGVFNMTLTNNFLIAGIGLVINLLQAVFGAFRKKCSRNI